MVLQWSCILWFWPWLPAAAGLYGWLQWRRQAARQVAQRVVVETQELSSKESLARLTAPRR